ncbi:uncharacterized protein LOC144109558 [Amblyomma americanum]
MSVFQGFIVRLARKLQSDVADPLEKELKNLKPPQKELSCSLFPKICLPSSLHVCLNNEGSCYERMTAMYSCFVEKDYHHTYQIYRWPIACEWLSYFPAMIRSKEPWKMGTTLLLLEQLPCQALPEKFYP